MEAQSLAQAALYASVLLLFFFVTLFVIISPHLEIFVKRYGRRHRFAGAVHLVVLMVGVVDLFATTETYKIMFGEPINLFGYHVVLSISGIILTLTAAFDFRRVHSRMKNLASGALHKTATITFSEMMEHSFYQGLNLLQISYLHLCTEMKLDLKSRLSLVFLVTAPWLFRHYFPVNHFSDNYTKGQSTNVYSILYRIKKYQYVAYKHFFLHGMNLTFLFQPYQNSSQEAIDVKSMEFKCYWLLLNTAYVMEFFLQSLVKKNHLSQKSMLVLNQYLMVIGSVSGALLVLKINWFLAFTSMLLNFSNRGKDFYNTSGIILVYGIYRSLVSR